MKYRRNIYCARMRVLQYDKQILLNNGVLVASKVVGKLNCQRSELWTLYIHIGVHQTYVLAFR
jgi:hypothetical protein